MCARVAFKNFLGYNMKRKGDRLMALIQLNFESETIGRTVEVMVILPVENSTQNVFSTIYLLHGLMGNHMDYLNHTDILQWAMVREIAVVMPNGENSYYVDWSHPFHAYGQFIGEELVWRTRQMFPLSSQVQNTMLAGLSMGGFGALRNGLKYTDTFGYVAALSSALNIYEKPEQIILPQEKPFLNLENGSQTDKNPRWLANQCALSKNQNNLKLFLACGLEDPYFNLNLNFSNELQNLGFSVKFHSEHGKHDWSFWNPALKAAIDWFYDQEHYIERKKL